MSSWQPGDQFKSGAVFLRWTLLVLPIGVLTGVACAGFLWALDKVTQTRFEYPWLLYLLPIGGVAVGAMYHHFAGPAERGNNLIMDEIHKPGGGVPARMAPLVLIGTLVTHLFGGSAGREGTAVQMGGSIAGYYSRLIRVTEDDSVRIMLMAGIAAGFGGVFGTPIAGAIFAMEVLSIGRMSYGAIVPCLVASIVSDETCKALGIAKHVDYHFAGLVASHGSHPGLEWILLGKVIVASVGFGLAALLFAELVHGLSARLKQWIPSPYLRPLIGGAAVIGMVFLVGSRDYLGIGVTSPDMKAVTIVSCFDEGGAQPLSWLWKLLFTVVTLSSGFKGGEVTPLFFIGAALGNSLALLMGAPVELFAALGFVAVFSGATNTPLACTIMAMELFGPTNVGYFAVACFIAYLFSGPKGIYSAQRIGTPKQTVEHRTE